MNVITAYAVLSKLIKTLSGVVTDFSYDSASESIKLVTTTGTYYIPTSQVIVSSVKGDDGKSAYEIAVDHGYIGTEEEWLKEISSTFDDTEIQEAITTIQNDLNNKLDAKQDVANAGKILKISDTGEIVFENIGAASGNDAENVAYENSEHSDWDNVEKALDGIISKVYYVEPQILTFVANPVGGVFEIGTSVTAPTFTWSYNKDMISQTLSNITLGDVTDRAATYTSNITADITFTLTANDGEKSVNKAISYTFVSPYYVGVSTTDTLDEAGIKGLTKKVETKGTKSIDFITSQSYMVFAYPSSYGNVTKVTDANGFDVTGSFTKSSVTVDSVNYNVYVSNKCSGSYKMTFSV